MSDDKKGLSVKLYWLCKGPYGTSIRLRDAPLPDGREQGPGKTRLMNFETLVVIRSGICYGLKLMAQQVVPCLTGTCWRGNGS